MLGSQGSAGKYWWHWKFQECSGVLGVWKRQICVGNVGSMWVVEKSVSIVFLFDNFYVVENLWGITASPISCTYFNYTKFENKI